MDKLEAQAAAAKAINVAKHKAAGKNFRTEIAIANARTGTYAKTIVVYSEAQLTAQRIGALILREKGSIGSSKTLVEAI